MPEEPNFSTNVLFALNKLEKPEFKNCLSSEQSYNVILEALETEEQIELETLKRLLTVCVRHISSLKFTTHPINVILALLAKVENGKYEVPDLVPSALEIMRMIKTLATASKVDSLITLAYETLLSYPDETLVAVAAHHEDVLEVFNIYCHEKKPIQIRKLAFNLLYKLLKILPHEEKAVFVEKGTSVWLSKVIPIVMTIHCDSEMYLELEILELLTEDLVHLNYRRNPHWMNLLECICDTTKYPAVMNDLLHSGTNIWHRLWMVFIRLLGQQITESLSSVGSPINSMLPVVEMAFKQTLVNRCRAFECWNVLIDSFADETNESNFYKRIKLVIIPLKSNNAKNEKTALAKFKCWWHLIVKFQNKMDKFLDTVLISFLYFCFGKHNAVDKTALVPGMLSDSIKMQSQEAIVEMVGHVNCNGCTDLPKLNGKIINTKHLVDNWNQWIYSLTTVIMKTATSSNGLSKQQLTCLWKSFLVIVSELPNNNIRKDLFAEILSIVDRLIKECASNIQFMDLAFNILILSLFDDATNIKLLLNSKVEPTAKAVDQPFAKIVKTILSPSLYDYYESMSSSELVSKFKIVTNLVFYEGLCNPNQMISKLLTNFPTNNYGLMFWSAMAESICESEYNLCNMVAYLVVLWPLESKQNFTELKIPALTWYKLYDTVYHKLMKTEIYVKIWDSLPVIPDTGATNTFFKICVLLGVMKNKFTENNCSSCVQEISLLLSLTKSIDNYENFEEVLPILIERIVSIMAIVTKNVTDTVTPIILVCVKNVLHVLTKACKQQSDVSYLMALIANLLRPLEALFAVQSYSKLIPAMTYHLLKCSPLLSKHSETRNIILSVMKIILLNTRTTDLNYKEIESVINNIERQISSAEYKKKEDTIFTTPAESSTLKKKKEVNIVSTVVENGEEYVVVKSNWKFNPRKLTENQKEKLQRKREDIPALYQDLSQSQDEFRLVSWKTDSQDTTSSSRSESTSNKPASNETASEILKNMPSTNVLPTILETLFSEKEKRNNDGQESTDVRNTAEESTDVRNKVQATTPTTKNTKSPRMALKDRVFRNVKNLMLSSGLQKEYKDSPDDPNKTNYSKTPTHVKDYVSANVSNSAPPLLSADRPSRVKRKPKKFEDLQILQTSKRSRHSSHDVDTGKESDESPSVKTDLNNIINDCTNEKNNIHLNNSQESPEGVGNMDITSDNVIIEGKNSDTITEIKDQISKNVRGKQVTGTNIYILNCIDLIEKSADEQSKNKTNSEVAVSESKIETVENITLRSSTNCKEAAVDKESENVECSSSKNDALIPKALKGRQEDLTSSTSNDDKVMSTPKRSKPIKEIPTPSVSKDVTEMSTQETTKDEEAYKTLNSKEMSTPRTSKLKDNLKAKNIKDISAPKNHKDISTPNLQEVVDAPKTAKAYYKDHSTSKDIDDVLTPENIKNTANISNIHEVATTARTSKAIKDVSTHKNIEDSSKVTNIQEQSTPRIIRAVKDALTPKSSKHVSSQDSSEFKELSTPKPLKESATTKSSKDDKATNPNVNKNDKEVFTPKQSIKGDEQKSSAKKSTVKKSRIEKELAIDTVEGHPFLKTQSEKRMTRKALETVNTGRRKSVLGKLNKSKSEGMVTNKKTKEKNKESDNSAFTSVVVDESQDKDSEPTEQTSLSDELPYSEDVIESSQDSTITSISVKSTRKTPKKVPVVCMEKLKSVIQKTTNINNSHSILDCVAGLRKSPTVDHDSKDDSELPLNKTASEDKNLEDLTQDMDTQPMDEEIVSKEFLNILIDNDVPMTIDTNDTVMGPETQEIAEADTQPPDLKVFLHLDEAHQNISETAALATITDYTIEVTESCVPKILNTKTEVLLVPNELSIISKDINNTTLISEQAAFADKEPSSGSSSPFKDEIQRQQDFLNNTIQISPIKTMSPDRNKKSPSPETSSDYVVIQLSSPVHSNGEPFDKCDSPEVFTEDKVSPDKRDQSPPRVEISLASTITSPSSALSLKKNRPQVRSGGRAAQMLGLCVPDKVQAVVNPERSQPEEIKKITPTNTPARRNLRIFYNSVADNMESSNSTTENDDSENFLKFRRTLPGVDSSPSGPILKRKLIEITDDAMISPASKRKRVSFHDPPVSTTISVQKYIESGGVRSPQNSAQKRLEIRQHTPLKSPKRLDNVFKLDTVLTKTIESFSDTADDVIVDDTEQFSLDETPDVEIVRASELNDTDAICPELLDCKDSIENIAGELSSSAMKALLIKKLEGKVETVGDLAKMTELEVNRLCIKAPKVKVAKKVLMNYVVQKAEMVQPDLTVTLDAVAFDEPMTEAEVNSRDVNMQTVMPESMDMAVQTQKTLTRKTLSQTDPVPTTHASIQTNESGSKSSAEIIKSCLSEKPDFVEQLREHLEESSIQHMSEKLPLSAVMDLLMKKISPSDSKVILNRILEQESFNDRNKELLFIKDLVCTRFESKDLILLCSQVLQVAYNKTA